MGQKMLSICIGNKTIRMAEVSKEPGKNVTVTNAFEIQTPNGCVDDGLLTDVNMLAEAIRVAIYGKSVSAKKIIFSVISKKIANKEVLIPYVKSPKKIKEILNANSGEYFPMSNVSDYIFGYSLIGTTEENENKKYRVYATAAPKEMIATYYDLAEQLKLPIENIDYSGNSVLQVLGLHSNEGTALILQIEQDFTMINILKDNVMVLQRSVPYGKSAVVGALIDLKGITERDARLLLSNKQLLDQQVTPAEYNEALRYLINSIVRIVEYYGGMHKDAVINSFQIFGEGSQIAGIEEALQHEIGAEVTHLTKLKSINVKSAALLAGIDPLYYINSIGAVIKPVGLTIVTDSKEADDKIINQYFYMGMVGAAIIAVVWVAVTLFGYFSSVNERNGLQEDIAKIEDIEQIVTEYNNALNGFETVNTFYDSTKNANEGLSQYLTDLEAILPSSVGFDSLQVSSGAVSVSASCTGKLDVAELILQLKSLKYVSNVFVFNINETYDENGVPTSNFNITCNLNYIEEETAAEAGAEPAETGTEIEDEPTAQSSSVTALMRAGVEQTLGVNE